MARTPLRLALAAALAIGLAVPAQSATSSGTQVIQGTVIAQFGFAVDADGHVSPNATTIPASVTREYRDGVEVITVAPIP